MRAEARTDADGRYSIPVEGRQAYQVRFGPIEGLAIRPSRQEVRLSNYRSCATVAASALYDGRLAGQIVDARGRPVPFLPISLLSSPRLLQQHTLTDAAGRFQFREVYPGAHDVAPSTSLWKGPRALPLLTQAPLAVAPAGRVDAGRLRLPSSLNMTLVQIIVETSDGRPATGAQVTFKQPDEYHAISYAPAADQAGRFRVTVLAGRRYEVEAAHTRTTAAGTVFETGKVVVEASGTAPVHLRLAPPR
jgi:hypothetical protein